MFRYTRHALELVWSTSRRLTVALAALTLLAGVLPAAIAFVGAKIVDAVVAAVGLHQSAGAVDLSTVLSYVVLEGVFVAALAAVQRGLSTCQSLLRAQLGQRVNEMILEKALTLDLRHFEDSEFYDKLTRARREASTRPLALVMSSFGLVQNAIALLSFGTLLAQFSPWAVAVLLLAGLPSFVAEAKFSGDAFRLFRWRSPETRMQMYLETVIAREDHAKEVKLFELGPRLLERYRAIFQKVFREDRALTIRRDTWGFFLGLVSTAAFYAAYAWVAVSAVRGQITLGQMTMYVLLFRQGQAAVSAILSSIGGMYEDNLYLSTLYEYLDTPVAPASGTVTTRFHTWHRVDLRAGQLHVSGRDRASRTRRELHAASGRKPGAGRRERLRQDDVDQAADAAVHAGHGPHPSRRHRPRGVGAGQAAPPHRRDLPGLRALPAARWARTSARAT